MDWMQKLAGGRKFLMSLIIIGAGIYLELHRADGISASMAGLLAAILATFSAANTAISQRHMDSRVEAGKPAPAEFPPEYVEQGKVLINVLTELGRNVQEVRELSTNTAKAVVNLGKGRS